MKKSFILILLLFLALSFVACGDSAPATEGNSLNPDLDFKSVLDTETGNIFSLGDSLQIFENTFGSGVPQESFWANMPFASSFEPEMWTEYTFISGMLLVSFFDDRAIEMRVYSDRFIFQDMAFDMTIEELKLNFIIAERLEGGYYNANYYLSFDKDGAIIDVGPTDPSSYRKNASVRDGEIVALELLWTGKVLPLLNFE